MARLPRLSVPHHPHHVIQRGNNRQTIFTSAADFEKLKSIMSDAAERFDVQVHAYVLMSNHIHLLITPSDEKGLPLFMQALGRSYVQYFNKKEGRTGTLWEGRYKSTVIQSERYLLTCMAYMDLNPVRAGMVQSPKDYAWSSHKHYVGATVDKVVTPHPLYWELGNTPFSREAAYFEMVNAGVSAAHHKTLTDHTHAGWAAGDESFVEVLSKVTDRRATKAKVGRPVGSKK